MARHLLEWKAVLKQLAAFFSAKYGYVVTHEDVELAVNLVNSDKYKIQFVLDFISVEPDFETLKRDLADFDFKTVKYSIALPPEIIPQEFFIITKAKIRNNGKIWYVHKYDVDPFPSSPHAHLLETNLKLDLSNGSLYHIRQYQSSISKKELLIVRQKISKALPSIQLPTLQV